MRRKKSASRYGANLSMVLFFRGGEEVQQERTHQRAVVLNGFAHADLQAETEEYTLRNDTHGTRLKLILIKTHREFAVSPSCPDASRPLHHSQSTGKEKAHRFWVSQAALLRGVGTCKYCLELDKIITALLSLKLQRVVQHQRACGVQQR